MAVFRKNRSARFRPSAPRAGGAVSYRLGHERQTPFKHAAAMPATLPIASLNHVAVVTRRLDASKKFYCDVLGFREVPRPNFDFPGAWLYGYGVTIHILGHSPAAEGAAVEGPAAKNAAEKPSGEIQTREPHLAFHAADLDTVEQLLQQHGIPFRRNRQADTTVRQLFFRDPDGFHIEVGSYPTGA
jgi:glyoxylase I family protein